MTAYPSAIDHTMHVLDESSVTDILMASANLALSLEPIRHRLPESVRLALDAYWEAVGE